MTYAAKIILHTPLTDPSRLPAFVEDCLADGVSLIAVVGKDAHAVEDKIDWLIIGDGDEDRFIVTSAHADETIEDVLVFASAFNAESGGEIEEVRI